MKKMQVMEQKSASLYRQKMLAKKVRFICISSRIRLNLKKRKKKKESCHLLKKRPVINKKMQIIDEKMQVMEQKNASVHRQ